MTTTAATAKPLAVLMGVGDGLSASVARLLFREGYQLTLAARDITKLQALADETQATCVSVDATSPAQVQALFDNLPAPPAVAVYNPSGRVRGAISEVDPEAVRKALEVTTFGSFLFGQQAAKAMLQAKRGTILFTGASAGVKGFPYSASFAMGKFGQRGLAQSMSRELHPQNIHVAWINIDGGIGEAGQTGSSSDRMLDPDEIAKVYLHLIQQHRSVWTEEMAVRPWVEKF